MANSSQSQSTDAWLDDLDPNVTPARDGRYLRRIGETLDNLDDAERDLHGAIDAARSAGESWSAIGMVLGTSRQAAHRKFGRKAS